MPELTDGLVIPALLVTPLLACIPEPVFIMVVVVVVVVMLEVVILEVTCNALALRLRRGPARVLALSDNLRSLTTSLTDDIAARP